jgi:hypothetical protein
MLPSLFLFTEKIPWCDAFTDLVIDGRLRFDRQVTKLCSRIYATLHILNLLKLLTQKRVRLSLFFHFSFSFFDLALRFVTYT